MFNATLATKITLPPLQQGRISRLHLLQQMADRPGARLVLVCAPAGFGKTSCLIEWCHALREVGTRVAWYALDRQDNDPVRFATHLARAFRIAVEGLLPETRLADATDDLEAVAVEIVNNLARTGARCVLALDDYHLITAPAIHAALSLMLEHLPANAQIGISSRADPPVQLSRLRARGQVLELRAADLRFSRPEIDGFFQQALGVALSQSSIAHLNEISEGWAAALRLIALSLEATHEQVNDALIERTLNRFSTAQRYIFDYFADEVFAHQSDTVRRFLLDTCVLNELTPEVCSALAGGGAPLILEQLARGDLFLIPLASSAPVYRYHHLVEDFLRQRLRLEDQERFEALHRTAAQWYETHSRPVEAVNHALTAGDHAYAAWLIEERAWEPLTSRGEIMTLLGWQPAFSSVQLRQHPRLCLYFSRALYLTGDIERSDAHLQLAVTALAELGDDVPGVASLRAIALNYQATLAGYRGQAAEGLTLVAQAAPYRSALDALGAVRLVNTTGYLYFLTGDLMAARATYEEALDHAQHIKHLYLTVDALYYLAQIDLLSGQLGRAQTRCQAFLDAHVDHIPPFSALLIPLAVVHYERNALPQAEALLRESIHLARRGNIPDTLWYASILLAEVQMARGRSDEAAALVGQAERIAAGFRSAVMQSLIGAVQARMWLRARRMDEALVWAERYAQQAPAGFLRAYEDLTLARVWLAHGQPESALRVLESVIQAARADGRQRHLIEAELLRAMASSALGEHRAAMGAFTAALEPAATEGYSRIFLAEGEPVIRLLRHAVDEGIAVESATRLLREAENASRRVHPADALTERERDVLRLLAQGASNQDIMQALVISLGTVKSHINHIMSKLDARNRTEAVARARSLGILED